MRRDKVAMNVGWDMSGVGGVEKGEEGNMRMQVKFLNFHPQTLIRR